MIVKQEDIALKLISNAIKSSTEQAKHVKPSDEFDTYGSFIASELRSIADQFTRDKIKHEIGQVFFNAKWISRSSAEAGSNEMSKQFGSDNSTITIDQSGITNRDISFNLLIMLLHICYFLATSFPIFITLNFIVLQTARLNFNSNMKTNHFIISSSPYLETTFLWDF